MTEIPKLGHILEELNLKPFFEQATPSRSSGKSLGADLPPPPQVIKGPKSAMFYRVKGWSNMLFNGIARYLEANFEFLFLCYFFAWVFVCAIFYTFSNYDQTYQIKPTELNY